jgi:hypothetical protein
MKYIIALSIFATTACTDADTKQLFAFGSSAEVVCYSGGKEIYRGMSTGKVATEKQSDGWYFSEAGTGKLIRVSGDCLIKN